MDLFRTLKEHISTEALIAEMLGCWMNPSHLLEGTGLPGMKVLLFGFDGDDSEYLCHNYTYNSVAYIGTHDNETLNGWIFNPRLRPYLGRMPWSICVCGRARVIIGELFVH